MTRKAFWNSIFFIAAIAGGLALSVAPWQKYHEVKKKADGANAEARAAEIDHAERLRQKAALDSTEGKEKLARQKGYIGPGETSLPRSQNP